VGLPDIGLAAGPPNGVFSLLAFYAISRYVPELKVLPRKDIKNQKKERMEEEWKKDPGDVELQHNIKDTRPQ
jgi:hypothetical protein